jgi:hypothetical protein
MNKQDIKTKTPKNATDIDADGIYWLISSKDKPKAYLYDDWTYCEPRASLRSLADIKRIVELEKALDKIIDRAQQVDGWESFPESWIDEAYETLKEPTL